jgi:hypothetical protein
MMIRRKPAAVPRFASRIAASFPRTLGAEIAKCRMKYKNEEATRQQGSLFFKGE